MKERSRPNPRRLANSGVRLLSRTAGAGGCLCQYVRPFAYIRVWANDGRGKNQEEQGASVGF